MDDLNRSKHTPPQTKKPLLIGALLGDSNLSELIWQ